MNILVAAGHLPSPNGRQAGAKTSYFLCEYLARQHKVHLLAFATRYEMENFDEIDMSPFSSWQLFPISNLNRVVGAFGAPMLPFAISVRRSLSFLRAFRKTLKISRTDAVIFDHTAMCQYLDYLPRSVKTVGNTHDILTQNWDRRTVITRNPIVKELIKLEAKRLRKWESETCKKLDFVLVPSEKDKCFLLDMQPHANVLVIDPWVSFFDKDLHTVREPGSLLFWGAMNREENADAARRAVEGILPRIRQSVPNAKLYIAGSHGNLLAREFAGRSDVVVTGFVQDVGALMASKEVALLPLRKGAGIKIKTLECMSAGLPVVTTSVGEEGIGGKEGIHYYVAESDEAIAKQVVRLLCNPEIARKMGSSAKAFVQKRLSFADRIKEVERALNERVSQSSV